MSDPSSAEDVAELRRRIEVLERYVAMSMRSSHMTWAPGGLRVEGKIGHDQMLMQLFGFSPWDPKALDPGG